MSKCVSQRRPDCRFPARCSAPALLLSSLPRFKLNGNNRRVRGGRVQSRALTIRLIRLAMAAALVFPLALFLFASWSSYRTISALADERMTRSLDIEQEEAAKDFELIGLIMRRAAELVAGMDANGLRANEEHIHDGFADLTNAVAAVQSIAVYAPDGHVLATSASHPPPSESFADRDFIA